MRIWSLNLQEVTASGAFTLEMIASIFVPSLLIHGAVHRVEHMVRSHGEVTW